jgi:3-hydroxyisobutyrate dehydrogenase-like beta-hydroxyacid dehydrogenase
MPAIADRSRVGLIGLGLLGEALARRLIGAGFPVTGYDLDAAKNASFESLGGRAVNSPAVVAVGCDCIVLAVFSTDQVETVVERELLPRPSVGGAVPALDELGAMILGRHGRGLRPGCAARGGP